MSKPRKWAGKHPALVGLIVTIVGALVVWPYEDLRRDVEQCQAADLSLSTEQGKVAGRLDSIDNHLQAIHADVRQINAHLLGQENSDREKLPSPASRPVNQTGHNRIER